MSRTLELQGFIGTVQAGAGVGVPRGGGRLHQYVATVIVDLLHFGYGLAIGWPATALPVLMSDATPLSSGPLTQEDASWLAAVFYLVAAPSMLVYGCVCQRFGRKACGYAIGVPYTVSAVLLTLSTTASTTASTLLASKLFLGLSCGGIFVLSPVYVSEIADARVRGSLGVLLSLMRNVGILCAYVWGACFSLHTVACLSLIPPLLFLAGLSRLPETPAYLLSKGKQDKAVLSLLWFRGQHCDVRQELDAMQANDKDGSSLRAPLTQLLASRGSVKAVLIALMLCFNQQMCGFFGIVSYAVVIFDESGGAWSASASSMVLGVMLVLGTLLAALLCDRTGRRVLFVLSDAFMIASLSCLGAYFYLRRQHCDTTAFAWLPVAALSVYVVSYNVGVATLPIVVITEIFPARLRNLAVTLNGFLIWIVIFVVTRFFPAFSQAVGMHAACWLFALCCGVGLLFIVCCLPETRHRPLDAIAADLQGQGQQVSSIS